MSEYSVEGKCANCGAPTDPDYGHVGNCRPAPPAQAAQVDADELRVLRADAKSAIGMVELLRQARKRLDDVHGQLYCLRTLIDQCHAKGALLEYTDKVIKLTRYQTAADTPTAEPVAQGETVASYIDAAALRAAQEIALMWGLDRSHFIAKIQVRIIDVLRRCLVAQPRAVPDVEAKYKRICDAFDAMKTSTSERFLECLGIDGDVCKPLDELLTAAPSLGESV